MDLDGVLEIQSEMEESRLEGQPFGAPEGMLRVEADRLIGVPVELLDPGRQVLGWCDIGLGGQSARLATQPVVTEGGGGRARRRRARGRWKNSPASGQGQQCLEQFSSGQHAAGFRLSMDDGEAIVEPDPVDRK